MEYKRIASGGLGRLRGQDLWLSKIKFNHRTEYYGPKGEPQFTGISVSMFDNTEVKSKFVYGQLFSMLVNHADGWKEFIHKETACCSGLCYFCRPNIHINWKDDMVNIKIYGRLYGTLTIKKGGSKTEIFRNNKLAMLIYPDSKVYVYKHIDILSYISTNGNMHKVLNSKFFDTSLPLCFNGIDVLYPEIINYENVLEGLMAHTYQKNDKAIEGQIIDKLCTVCMTEKTTKLFIRCGHYCVCESCSERLQDCPICRTKSSTIKVYEMSQ